MNAPIIIFVYNRPQHTKGLLHSLSQNYGITESDVFFYADGPKLEATGDDIELINATRKICEDFSHCRSSTYKFREKNLGLAENILDGVTEVINEHGKAIILEDDLELSSNFLRYMNRSLELYENDEKMYHVSGYWFPVKETDSLPPYFFLRLGTCWGWATWARAWNMIERNPSKLKEQIKQIDPKFKKYSFDGTASFLDQLDANIEGTMKTWAIKWYSTIFINKGYSINPNTSYVNNGGHDGTGEHCGNNNGYHWPSLNTNNTLDRLNINYCEKAEKQLKIFFDEVERNRKRRKSGFKKLRRKMKKRVKNLFMLNNEA